ncbi:hypothetical protein [Streptomyces sp. NPDC006335]
MPAQGNGQVGILGDSDDFPLDAGARAAEPVPGLGEQLVGDCSTL